MPEKWLLWCSLGISLLSTALAVASVVVCSRVGSRFTRVLTRKPPSESTLAKLAVDQAELFSSLDSLTTTVKRLSSRRGMQELRSDRAASEIPNNLSKAELRRRIFGSKSQAEIVSMARGG